MDAGDVVLRSHPRERRLAGNALLGSARAARRERARIRQDGE
jgi:hypothetical protein